VAGAPAEALPLGARFLRALLQRAPGALWPRYFWCVKGGPLASKFLVRERGPLALTFLVRERGPLASTFLVRERGPWAATFLVRIWPRHSRCVRGVLQAGRFGCSKPVSCAGLCALTRILWPPIPPCSAHPPPRLQTTNLTPLTPNPSPLDP
jgi:hypothetical protein